MKLVSVNAVLIGAFNFSLFIKVKFVEGQFLPWTLLILSIIYIDLILLMEYEHRRFNRVEVNIKETASLTRKLFNLFAAGIALTLHHKFQYQKCNQYIKTYVLLGQNIYYSLLYYFINLLLGNCYMYLFFQNYAKANRERIPSEIASQVSEEHVCSICLGRVREGQNVAKIACMHMFHSQCLHKWCKKKTTCPVCKSRIDIV